MIDVDYLHEPLDWHDKSCEACGKDLEKHAGNELDPVVVHFSGPETQVPAYKYSVKGSILLCGDCRYKLSRLLS
jgi:hypothetical protein